jgi:hypothetical protein
MPLEPELLLLPPNEPLELLLLLLDEESNEEERFDVLEFVFALLFALELELFDELLLFTVEELSLDGAVVALLLPL